VHVADAHEQVVLHLEVEPADQPAQHAVVARKIHRGLQLMDRPGRLHAAAGIVRLGKVRFHHHVCQLEHDRQQESRHRRHRGVEQHHRAR
jgi:hypothetical protein